VRLLDELEPQRPVDDNRADPKLRASVTGLSGHAIPFSHHHQRLPPNATGSSAFEAFTVWAEAGRMYVVTFGSSSCPKVPTGVSASADNRLTVRAKPISDGPCTMDIRPTTSLVDVPAGIDDSKPVEVTIDGVVSVLPPR
jgi:hypothetical protein